MTSVAARWLFASHASKLRQEHDRERETCRAVRAEMESVVNQLSLLALQLKQLKSRRAGMRKTLAAEEKAQQEFLQMEEAEREKAAKQEELLRITKKKGRK